MQAITMPKIKPATNNPMINLGLKQAVKPVNPKTKSEKAKRPKVWAIDFDGTLCQSRYPDIGKPCTELIEALKMARANGIKLILWTTRTDQYLDAALAWCSQYGLEFDAVNENVPEMKEMYGNDPRKIGADLYIDDRAFPWWGNGEWGKGCRLLEMI